MEPVEFSKSVNRCFHDVDYDVSVSGDANQLIVEVSQTDDPTKKWAGTFSSKFVEEITKKTHNFKPYPVFIKMLFNSLTCESDTVYLDLLTLRDLDMLRHRSDPRAPPSASAKSSNNRYMILTYQAEFDKVHYPLQLAAVEQLDLATLQATVAKLRDELQETRAALKAEREKRPSADGDSRLRAENEALQQAVTMATSEVERLRGDVASMRSGRPGTGSDSQEVKVLRQAASKHQAEIKAARLGAQKQAAESKKEVERLARELTAARNSERRLKTQVERMERELADLRVRARPGSNRPAPRSASVPRSVSRPSSAASSVASSRNRGISPGAGPARPREPGRVPGYMQPRVASRGRTPSPGTRGGPAAQPRPAPAPARNGRSPSPYAVPSGPSVLALARAGRSRTPSPSGSSRALPQIGSRGVSPQGPSQRWRPGSRSRTPSPAASLDSSARSVSPRSFQPGGVRPPPAARRHQPREQQAPFKPAERPALPQSVRDVGGESDAGDIDARLAALQNFLKSTKSGT
mmetsp:Transcript_45053/g.102102  ORF Transcript_45053/g.102102 Transcript_45053/m.102102 type:complete len:523 (+) Transcript_45053:30-1598(+)